MPLPIYHNQVKNLTLPSLTEVLQLPLSDLPPPPPPYDIIDLTDGSYPNHDSKPNTSRGNVMEISSILNPLEINLGNNDTDDSSNDSKFSDSESDSSPGSRYRENPYSSSNSSSSSSNSTSFGLDPASSSYYTSDISHSSGEPNLEPPRLNEVTSNSSNTQPHCVDKSTAASARPTLEDIGPPIEKQWEILGSASALFLIKKMYGAYDQDRDRTLLSILSLMIHSVLMYTSFDGQHALLALLYVDRVLPNDIRRCMNIEAEATFDDRVQVNLGSLSPVQMAMVLVRAYIMCLKLASEWLDDRIWSLSTWLNTTHMEPNVYKRTFRQLSVMIDYNIYVGTSEWFAWLDHIRLQLLEPLNSVFPNHDNGYSFETVVNSIFNCSTNRLPHLNNTFSEVSPPKPYACQPYYKQMERFLLFLTYNLPEHSTDPQDFVCGEPAPDGVSKGAWFRGYIPVPVDYDADVLVYDAPQIVKSDSNDDVESHDDGDKEDNDNDSDQDEEGDSESEEDMHLLSQPQRRLLHSKFGIPERHFGHYVLVEEDDSDCSVDDEAMMEDEDIEYSTHVQHDTCEVEQEEEFEYNHDELYEDQPAHEGDQCMVVNGSEPSHGFMSSGFSNSVPTFEDNSLGVDLVVVQQQQLRHLYSAPRVFVDSSGRVHDVDEFSFQVSERIGGGHEWHVQYPNSDGGMDRYVMECSESIGLQVAPRQRVPLATLFYSPL